MLVASCTSEEFVDRATLLRDPAAKLRFPGAVELGHVGGEREDTFEGPRGAFDGYILGTQVSEQEVFAYYATELERMGWLRDPLVGTRATTELMAYGWCKGRMNFRLGIEDQPRAYRPEFYRGHRFATVFSATIDSRRLSRPCSDAPTAS